MRLLWRRYARDKSHILGHRRHIRLLMDIDTRKVRWFLAVAENESYTRAAERLRVSQSSLTRAVSAIEQEMGLRLLTRTTRKVELTNEGKKVKEDLQSWLRGLDEIMSRGEQSGILKLGFSWLLPDTWTEHAVRNFELETQSQVEFVRIDTRNAGVDTGDTDIAIVRGGQHPEGMHAVPLFRENRVLAVQNNSELALRHRVDWMEVAHNPIVINEASGTTDLGDWPAGQRPTVSARCRNLDEWIELIAAGRGIGVTTLSVPRRISHPMIRYLPLENAPKVGIYMIFPKQGTHPLASKFTQAALRAVKQMKMASSASENEGNPESRKSRKPERPP